MTDRNPLHARPFASAAPPIRTRRTRRQPPPCALSRTACSEHTPLTPARPRSHRTRKRTISAYAYVPTAGSYTKTADTGWKGIGNGKKENAPSRLVSLPTRSCRPPVVLVVARARPSSLASVRVIERRSPENRHLKGKSFKYSRPGSKLP